MIKLRGFSAVSISAKWCMIILQTVGWIYGQAVTQWPGTMMSFANQLLPYSGSFTLTD